MRDNAAPIIANAGPVDSDTELHNDADAVRQTGRLEDCAAEVSYGCRDQKHLQHILDAYTSINAVTRARTALLLTLRDHLEDIVAQHRSSDEAGEDDFVR